MWRYTYRFCCWRIDAGNVIHILLIKDIFLPSHPTCYWSGWSFFWVLRPHRGCASSSSVKNSTQISPMTNWESTCHLFVLHFVPRLSTVKLAKWIWIRPEHARVLHFRSSAVDCLNRALGVYSSRGSGSALDSPPELVSSERLSSGYAGPHHKTLWKCLCLVLIERLAAEITYCASNHTFSNLNQVVTNINHGRSENSQSCDI